MSDIDMLPAIKTKTMHYLYKTLNQNDYFRHFATMETNPNSPKGLTDKIIRFLYRSSCLFISFHHLKITF